MNDYIFTAFASIALFDLTRKIYYAYFEYLDVKRDWIEYTTIKK